MAGDIMNLLHKYPNDILSILRELGGWYECPRDAGGNRIGPLVGYAGRYGERSLQYVGDIYADCSKLEEFPKVLEHFAQDLYHVQTFSFIDVFCGAPLGGMAFATVLATMFLKKYIFPEKKILKLATAESREESELVFSRHGIKEDDRVAIVEDVCNNFSTTEKMIDMIVSAGGEVSAIVCVLNRSLEYEDYYYSEKHDLHIPIVSLIRKPIMQYYQHDSYVENDIAIGNVVWKPKDEWQKLVDAINNK